MDKKIEELLKRTDPNLVEKVDFKLSPVPGEVGQVIGWLNGLENLIAAAKQANVKLSKEDKYQLNDLKLFLKYGIDCHIESRLHIKIKNNKIMVLQPLEN